MESLLGDLFSNVISVRLMEHAATLDLAQFEDPTFYDHLERARRQTTGRIGLIAQLLGMAQDALTLVDTRRRAARLQLRGCSCCSRSRCFPSFLGETHYAALSYSLLFRRTPERRQLDYLRYAGASDETAKEVQAVRTRAVADGRYRRAGAALLRGEQAALASGAASVSALLRADRHAGLLRAPTSVILYAQPCSVRITIGTLTFLAGSFTRSRDLIQRILLLVGQRVFEQSLYLSDLFTFFEMQPTHHVDARARDRCPPRSATGFEFEDVGFRYPGSDRWAVRHLIFTLEPGRTGRSRRRERRREDDAREAARASLRPDEGRILLDGVDLRDYDLASPAAERSA